MSATLVIVESPTKAKTISRFLGRTFLVESSFGHVRDLPKTKMGIDIEHKTFEPSYVVSSEKKDRVKKLKALARQSSQIIFATDEDREGEAISWHLAELLKIDPGSAKRIVFHEITREAIEQALAHPRPIDQKLVEAQQARRILDRLVGYELSPFLWSKVARGLSAGRVQSVAVRLIVEREREILAFVPQYYWTLEGLFSKRAPKDSFPGVLATINNTGLKKFDIGTKERANDILADLQGAGYTVESIEQKEMHRTPPPPFTTSTLQQSANMVLGFSAKQTMMLAQQLYEGVAIGKEGETGLITYMRTDSVNVSDTFVETARRHIEQHFGSSYCAKGTRRYTNKSKGAQEAHEAIRPTDPRRTPESVRPFLEPRQAALYELIWKRALATQMAESRLNKTILMVKTNGKTGTLYAFRATGQTCIFDGWLRLYPKTLKEEMLPEMKKGEPVDCQSLKSEEHSTKPPARYSDATLVKALEEFGIGRPSTYAPTIGTIEERNYVERDEEKRLKPTEIGMVVTDLLTTHFPDIVDYQFTASMEQKLDEIAEGKEAWRPVISSFYEPFHARLEQKKSEVTKEDAVGIRQLGVDPKTNKPVSARVGRFGPFVQLGSKEDEEKPRFASLPKGQSVETATLEEALKLLSLPRSLGLSKTGEEIIVMNGRFGPYLKIEGSSYSLKTEDPYTIDLPSAERVIAEAKKQKEAALLKTFPGSEIVVQQGRFGPYITDGTKNGRIPKDRDPESLSLAECEEILKTAKPRRRRGRARRPTS